MPVVIWCNTSSNGHGSTQADRFGRVTAGVDTPPAASQEPRKDPHACGSVAAGTAGEVHARAGAPDTYAEHRRQPRDDNGQPQREPLVVTNIVAWRSEDDGRAGRHAVVAVYSQCAGCSAVEPSGLPCTLTVYRPILLP